MGEYKVMSSGFGIQNLGFGFRERGGMIGPRLEIWAPYPGVLKV